MKRKYLFSIHMYNIIMCENAQLGLNVICLCVSVSVISESSTFSAVTPNQGILELRNKNANLCKRISVHRWQKLPTACQSLYFVRVTSSVLYHTGGVHVSIILFCHQFILELAHHAVLATACCTRLLESLERFETQYNCQDHRLRILI